jgi:hypothetical protein
MIGGWRKLHNAELYDLWTLHRVLVQRSSVRLREARHMARIGEMRKEYKIFVLELEGKLPLRRSGRR